MIKLMLIAGVGGFIGTCARYAIGRGCAAVFSGSFPLATFLVNLIGCFVIGIIFGLMEKGQFIQARENALLITGFCGGFTTFSAFANEIWTLGSKGEVTTSVIYAAASVILGIALVWAGRLAVSIKM